MEPIATSINGAARALSLGRTSIYALIKEGKLEAVKSTVNGTVRELRAFFHWLADQPGYKKRIQYADADYFNLTEKDMAVARAKRPKRVPTLDQMHHILSVMPADSDLERRNRALIACAMLTGARVDALASFKLKHVNLEQGKVFQDARDVRTKFSKTFETWFFPVGGDAPIGCWSMIKGTGLEGWPEWQFYCLCAKISNRRTTLENLGDPPRHR
ncbi:hypothetical protein [Rhizorhapis sp. SPR117]|uniref:hypothetical protein n=1 Tax=Rhizorhapis sp. SPR117 TaxID=2912611 RepID=UPI001F4313C1|nr:hypothetical protein [Rhizorhapis sp. SPR117]